MPSDESLVLSRRLYYQSAAAAPHHEHDERRLLLSTSSRYIEAQIRNRMETARLQATVRCLERQQLATASLLDRQRRSVAGEMASIALSTGHSIAAAVAEPPSQRRRRHSKSATDRRNHRSTSRTAQLKADDHETPLAAAVSTPCSNKGKTGAERQTDRHPDDTTEPSQQTENPRSLRRASEVSSTVLLPRTCQSARGTTANHGAKLHVKRTSTILALTALTPDSEALTHQLENLPAAQYKAEKTIQTDDGTRVEERIDRYTRTTDHYASPPVQSRKADTSQWKRDLKIEAPPAVAGHRQSLGFPVVLSKTERRRRLAALQRQQLHSVNGRRQSGAA